MLYPSSSLVIRERRNLMGRTCRHIWIWVRAWTRKGPLWFPKPDNEGTVSEHQAFTQALQANTNTSQECKKITWFPPSSKPLSQMWTSPFLWIDKSDVQYDAPPCSNNDLQTRTCQHCKRELPRWVPMIRIDGKTSSSPNYWENLQMG
jgi:hypothetical protein